MDFATAMYPPSFHRPPPRSKFLHFLLTPLLGTTPAQRLLQVVLSGGRAKRLLVISFPQMTQCLVSVMIMRQPLFVLIILKENMKSISEKPMEVNLPTIMVTV